MSTRRTPKTSSKTAVVGDSIDFDKTAGYVRLPDGTVVTCRGSYVAAHPGEHVFFVTNDKNELVEVAKVEVARHRRRHGR